MAACCRKRNCVTQPSTPTVRGSRPSELSSVANRFKCWRGLGPSPPPALRRGESSELEHQHALGSARRLWGVLTTRRHSRRKRHEGPYSVYRQPCRTHGEGFPPRLSLHPWFCLLRNFGSAAKGGRRLQPCGTCALSQHNPSAPVVGSLRRHSRATCLRVLAQRASGTGVPPGLA